MLTTLIVQPNSDVDEEELDLLTTQLRRRLLDELDVDVASVATSDEAIPGRAKAVDASMLGTLALTLSPITLHSMFQLVQTWLKNRPIRTVKIVIGKDNIEVSHLGTSDQSRLIDSFIERHGSK